MDKTDVELEELFVKQLDDHPLMLVRAMISKDEFLRPHLNTFARAVGYTNWAVLVGTEIHTNELMLGIVADFRKCEYSVSMRTKENVKVCLIAQLGEKKSAKIQLTNDKGGECIRTVQEQGGVQFKTKRRSTFDSALIDKLTIYQHC